VTLKLFSAMVDANKLERALDLVDRLHLEVSHTLAIQIAGRHDKLADLIEEARDRKFPVEIDEGLDENDEEILSEEEDNRHSPEATTFMDRLAPSRQISPDAGHNAKFKRAQPRGNAFLEMTSKKQRLGA
jgi:hypothetical protein